MSRLASRFGNACTIRRDRPLAGRNAKGKRSHTRAVNGIDGDVKLNRALWVMAEAMLSGFLS